MAKPVRIVPGYRPTISDLENESRMNRLLNQISDAISTDEKRKLWNQYSKLHAGRSAGLVAHLEKQKGLFRGNEACTKA